MNHEARMKMYYKLLENKNYKKLKKLEDLKQFLDAEEYKYVENNIIKIKDKRLISFKTKLYATIFKINSMNCPICGQPFVVDTFYKNIKKCGNGCTKKIPVNLWYSARDEEFNFAKFLDKCRSIVKKYKSDLIPNMISYLRISQLMIYEYFNINDIDFFLKYFDKISIANILIIINGYQLCATCSKPTKYASRAIRGRMRVVPITYCDDKCREKYKLKHFELASQIPHEDRMNIYSKLLSDENYKNIENVNDLKKFIESNHYKIFDKFFKFNIFTLRHLYQFLFNIPEVVNKHIKCPICSDMIEYRGFNNIIICEKCQLDIRLHYSSSNIEFDLEKYLSKLENIILDDKYLGPYEIYYNYGFTIKEFQMHKEYFRDYIYARSIIKTSFIGHPLCYHCYKGVSLNTKFVYNLHNQKFCSIACVAKSEETREQRSIKCSETYHAKSDEEKERIQKAREATCNKKFGAPNPFAAPEIREKIKDTWMQNYGVPNPMMSPVIQEKVKETCIKRFGVPNPFAAPEIREKIKDTWMQNYGVPNPMMSPVIQEKVEETNLRKRGVPNPMMSPVIQEKVKETCIKRFGVPNPMMSPVVQMKVKETNLRKRGVPNPTQSAEVQMKIKETNLRKRGAPNPFQSAEVQMKIKENMYQGDLIPGTKEYNLEVYGTENPEEDLGVKHIDQYYDKKFIESKFTLDDGTFDFQSYLEYFNITVTTGYRHKEKLEIEIPNRYTTQGAIVNFIRDLGFEVLENNRKTIAPMELDLYVPEKNLAIEYHGLMFHSVGKSKYSMFDNYGTKRADYLRKLCTMKADLCDQKGIKLLQIFENEWLEHEETWKSIIKKELGIYKTVSIECIITHEIDRTQAQEFLKLNWIYDVNYTSSQALLYAGDIVALLLTDQNGHTRIIEHRDYRLLNLDKILKGKKVLVDRRLGGLDIIEHAASKEYLEPKCYGFQADNLILQETMDSQSVIDQGNRVIWDAGYIVLEF